MLPVERFHDACKEGNETAVLEYINSNRNNLDYVTAIVYLSMSKNIDLVKTVMLEIEHNDDSAKTKIEYHTIESCLYNAVRSGNRNMVLYFINYWDTVYIKLNPEHEERREKLIEHGISGVITGYKFGKVEPDGSICVEGTGINFDMVNLFLEQGYDPYLFFRLALSIADKELLKFILQKYKTRNFLEEYKITYSSQETFGFRKSLISPDFMQKAENFYNSVINPSILQKTMTWVGSIFSNKWVH